MLSKHPLELLRDKKLGPERTADALRLSIIAELDAVSLYLQLADAVGDERVKRVLEDIAREEKTHVGEFLALLKELDPQQAAELEAGEREVMELTRGKHVAEQSSGDPPALEGPLTREEVEHLSRAVEEVLSRARVLRRYLPVTRVGRGVDALVVEKLSEGERVVPGGRELVELRELEELFALSQRSIDAARRLGSSAELTAPASRAAAILARREDEDLTKTLLALPGALEEALGSWEAPGEALLDVSKALAALLRERMPRPYVLLVGTTRYARLLAIYEKTGLTELARLKALVEDVVMLPDLPDDVALLIARDQSSVDLVVGVDYEINYVGPEDGLHVFRLWSFYALRARNPRAVVILRERR
ncbi:MAG: family 1 encapsulin nanocompartment shell protein [Fervidicoccaceae archaeon]